MTPVTPTVGVTTADASDHNTRHEDAGADEITAALDPRAYPMLSGLAAARPAAGVSGRVYRSTDTNVIERDNGTTWDEIARGETATRLAQLSEKNHASLGSVTSDQHHAQLHATAHQDTGGDEISIQGLAGTPAELTTHAAAADPHTGYRLESADHTHQTTGAQAGQLDHGLALTGLTDDDHTQYQKESEKDAANGYAGLDANKAVTINQAIFPAVQVASADPNTMDDYEEGTWTPSLTFGGLAVGMTYSSRSGRYIKLGNTVIVDGSLILTAKGSSTGTAKIEGLPFATVSTMPVTIVLFYVTFANQAGAWIPATWTSAEMLETTEAGGVNVLVETDFTDTSQVYMFVAYRV